MSRTAIISVDGHVKASRAGYRDYVEQQYLDDYDASVKAAEDAGLPDAGNLNPEFGVEAQWDSDRRLEALESHGCGGRGAVPERPAVPGEPAGGLRAHAATPSWPPPDGRPTTGGSPTSAPRRRGGAPARRSSSFDDIDAGDRGRPLGQGARPRRDHDAGAQPRRHHLLRSRARPDLGRHPGRGPADQPARRRRCSRLQPAGVRRHHHARGGERVLLQPVAVAAHRRAACSTASRTCRSPFVETAGSS